MSNQLTGLLFGIGFGGWIYYQMMKRTNNTQASVITAIFCGAVAFFVVFTLLDMVFPRSPSVTPDIES